MAKPKRPRDMMQLAKLIGDIATGEIEDKDPNEGKNPKTVERARKRGLKGGKARAKSLTSKRRKEIAKKAAARITLAKGNDLPLFPLAIAYSIKSLYPC